MPISHRGQKGIVFSTGEQVFADLWQEYNRSGQVLSQIIQASGLGKTKRSDTTVASIVIQWLGTNLGQRFLKQVKENIGQGVASEQAFLGCWAKENSSIFVGCQDGLLAMLLVPTDKLSIYPGQSPVVKRDIQVANVVIAWLGSSEGERFLGQAQRLIESHL